MLIFFLKNPSNWREICRAYQQCSFPNFSAFFNFDIFVILLSGTCWDTIIHIQSYSSLTAKSVKIRSNKHDQLEILRIFDQEPFQVFWRENWNRVRKVFIFFWVVKLLGNGLMKKTKCNENYEWAWPLHGCNWWEKLTDGLFSRPFLIASYWLHSIGSSFCSCFCQQFHK